MPKLKNYGPGERRIFWLREKNRKMYNAIENKSEFINIALEAAIDIMAWDILKKMEPDVYKVERKQPVEEIIDDFNKKHPLDELTAKRLGRTNGQKPQRPVQPSRKESNPAL